jgi:hypothetical protein
VGMDLGRGGGLSPPICINVRNRRAENHEQMVILGNEGSLVYPFGGLKRDPSFPRACPERSRRDDLKQTSLLPHPAYSGFHVRSS